MQWNTFFQESLNEVFFKSFLLRFGLDNFIKCSLSAGRLSTNSANMLNALFVLVKFLFSFEIELKLKFKKKTLLEFSGELKENKLKYDTYRFNTHIAE